MKKIMLFLLALLTFEVYASLLINVTINNSGNKILNVKFFKNNILQEDFMLKNKSESSQKKIQFDVGDIIAFESNYPNGKSKTISFCIRDDIPENLINKISQVEAIIINNAEHIYAPEGVSISIMFNALIDGQLKTIKYIRTFDIF